MEFLLRYDNPFSRWLAERWCAAMISELALRLGDRAGAEFDRLDVTQSGRLSYSDLRPLIHETVPQSAMVVAMQSMHVFALLQRLDPDCTGFLAKDIFLSSLQQAQRHLSHCPQGHTLREERPSMVQGHVHQRQCDVCERIISREQMRRHCNECDYDFCEFCAAAGQLLNVAEFRQVRLKRRPTLGCTKIQLQWDEVHQAIRKLCQGHIDVRTFFTHLDSDKNGFVGRAEFVLTMTELLRSSPQSAGALWALAMEHCGTCDVQGAGRKVHRRVGMVEVQHGGGRLCVEDFVRCLAVMDCCPIPILPHSEQCSSDASLTAILQADPEFVRVSLHETELVLAPSSI